MTDVQTRSYDRFLQLDISPEKRQSSGLEGVLREIFPIESYDKTLSLEYIKYELGKPRYGPDECRQLRLTYGRPFRVWLRLNKEQPVEEEVYLGDMPIMIGGGEFIINGAERVVVSQLHRSPGVDYVVETEAGERKLHSCRIIPERGSWIEINVTKKETLGVRIDQSGKFSAMTLLRAMDPEYSDDADILKAFHTPKEVALDAGQSRDPRGRHRRRATSSIRRPARSTSTAGDTITKEHLDKLYASAIKSVHVLQAKDEKGKHSIRSSSTRSRKTRRTRTRRRCSRSISVFGRATRRSSKRPRSCSRRSSRTPTAIAWARSAASASTASSTRTSPRAR